MGNPIIETLTAAFYDDPLVKYLLPIQKSRAKRLSIAMEFLLGFSSHECPIGTKGEEYAGVIGVSPPGHYPPPFLNTLTLLTKLVFKSLFSGMPLGVISQWLRIFAQFDKMHPAEPHWYVQILGVHPNHQGKGLGRKLLRPILRKADADGVSVYLESSNPKNLDFYRKHGFEVIQEITPVDGCPLIRVLLRKPEPAGYCQKGP
jgi:GNAT superfamily N-acetyltransferase